MATLALSGREQATADLAEIQSADKVILPGVGMAATAMRQLHQQGLVDCIRGLSQPVLGVVENMSCFIPPDLPERSYALFGSGGGASDDGDWGGAGSVRDADEWEQPRCGWVVAGTVVGDL